MCSVNREKVVGADILLAVVAVLLLFWALGEKGLWTAEGRWAEVTREMFLTGDFFHPAINGEPYFDKPLLTYWLIALISTLTGRLDEWTVRLPSAISGLLALWATVYLGRRLWSAEVGRTAGWVLLTTYSFLFWSRAGTADMENMAAVTLALAWYWSRRDRPNFGAFFVFYLIAFIGSLTKGLTALIVPVLAVLPDVLAKGRWRTVLRPSHFLAMALAGGIYLAPFIYASITRADYQASGLALVFQENIQRFFQPFDHKGPFYCYFYYLPMLFMPWTPLFLAACAGMARGWKGLDSRTRWLIKAALLVFLFFTASGSRRSYYILPILPLCALWTAVFLRTDSVLLSALVIFKRWGLRIQAGLLAVLAFIYIASPVIWPVLMDRIGFVASQGLKVATLVCGLSVFGLLALSLQRSGLLSAVLGTARPAAPLVAAVAVFMGIFFCWQVKALEIYRTERPFSLELKKRLVGVNPEQVAFFRKVSPNVLFYLDFSRPVQLVSDQEAVRRFIESESTNVLISRRNYLAELMPILPADLIKRPDLAEKVQPWERKGSGKLVAWDLSRLKQRFKGSGVQRFSRPLIREL
jgi:4-amino-4-deoxy-L-arabinose transferase-like glycosyltransferase